MRITFTQTHPIPQAFDPAWYTVAQDGNAYIFQVFGEEGLCELETTHSNLADALSQVVLHMRSDRGSKKTSYAVSCGERDKALQDAAACLDREAMSLGKNQDYDYTLVRSQTIKTLRKLIRQVVKL